MSPDQRRVQAIRDVAARNLVRRLKKLRKEYPGGIPKDIQDIAVRNAKHNALGIADGCSRPKHLDPLYRAIGKILRHGGKGPEQSSPEVAEEVIKRDSERPRPLKYPRHLWHKV